MSNGSQDMERDIVLVGEPTGDVEKVCRVLNPRCRREARAQRRPMGRHAGQDQRLEAVAKGWVGIGPAAPGREEPAEPFGQIGEDAFG